MAEGAGLKRIVRPVFGGLAVGFIIYAALDLWTSWDGVSVSVRPEYLAGAALSAALAMYVQLIAWRVLIFHMTGTRMPHLDAARLYLDSQMARYTPGKIGLPVVRMSGAQSVGVSPQVMGSALLLEIISWVATGSLLGASVLGLFPYSAEVTQKLSRGSVLLAAGSALGLVAVLTIDRRHYPSRLCGLLGANGSGPIIVWQLPGLHLLHFLLWIGSGALVCLSVGGNTSQALMTGAILCLAIVAGFLAFLAPAGAGVREAVVASGLAPVLGVSTSIAVSILARIVSLVSDVLLWSWFRLRTARSSKP